MTGGRVRVTMQRGAIVAVVPGSAAPRSNRYERRRPGIIENAFGRADGKRFNSVKNRNFRKILLHPGTSLNIQWCRHPRGSARILDQREIFNYCRIPNNLCHGVAQCFFDVD